MFSDREPIQRLEGLLAQYPDVLVQRQPLGHIVVSQNIPGPYLRLHMVLTVNKPDYPSPQVSISISRFPKNPRVIPRDNSNTAFIILPLDEEHTGVGVYQKELAIDIPEALGKIRQGFEIFDAFTHISPSERGRFRQRVSDLLTLEGLVQSQFEFERLRDLGLIYEGHDPANDWRYVYWLLKKGVREIKDL